MTSGGICQQGTVVSSGSSSVIVRITAQSACAACHAKEVCSPGDMEAKIIEAYSENPHDYHKGQIVNVLIKDSAGWLAVMFGYLIPAAILLAALFLFINLTGSEGLGALIAIVLLVPYYLILYMVRGRLKKKFRFEVEPTNEE